MGERENTDANSERGKHRGSRKITLVEDRRVRQARQARQAGGRPAGRSVGRSGGMDGWRRRLCSM
jgi:hypothetical protein